MNQMGAANNALTSPMGPARNPRYLSVGTYENYVARVASPYPGCVLLAPQLCHVHLATAVPPQSVAQSDIMIVDVSEDLEVVKVVKEKDFEQQDLHIQMCAL